jgi:hypothetical protein
MTYFKIGYNEPFVVVCNNASEEQALYAFLYRSVLSCHTVTETHKDHSYLEITLNELKNLHC